MKPKLRTVQVTPVLPEPLKALEVLAYNLYWDWNPDLESLFVRIDPELWIEVGKNPVVLLGQVPQSRFEALSADVGYLSHLSRAAETLERYKVEPRWYQTEHTDDADMTVAYFSAEFGLASCLPIYSGGLGILAGDHLKSASDLGVPLVGVGLLYQEGYFRQYLNADGWQMETYPPNDFYTMPIRPELDPEGHQIRIYVEFPGRNVVAQVWRAEVGRVPLFLLDTNVAENSDSDRKITRALYGGGTELRIQQLMMLGIGGFRALVAMGREPIVCHMNEGHAGFLGVERTRHLMMARGMSYELARDVVDEGNIFTTHTPVPAGFDVFGRDLVERYMSAYARHVGMSVDEFMALGRRHANANDEPLNMAVLAIRHAVQRNGVSRLHGVVSRALVQDGGAWSDWPQHEVPIDSVTNGIHTRTWTAPEVSNLLDRYLGPAWKDNVPDEAIWEAVDRIPSAELWRTHSALRQDLISYVRGRLRWQLERRGATERAKAEVSEVLDPNALTIGFARRVATYKRATLLFRDTERLLAILRNPERPVQFIFAGKAHPADLPAKELIREISSKLRQEAFSGSIIFLEDYEIDVAKHLVRGVDVWLNNPMRPKEASGTSGMKLLPNGGLNLSILDGWWAEGYSPDVGWAIGNGEDHEEGRDEVEASALYHLLEKEVVPLFYDRNARGVPVGWVQMMKASMKKLSAAFSSDRMVREYVDRFYTSTHRRVRTSLSGDRRRAEEILDWKRKVARAWSQVQVVDVSAPDGPSTAIGAPYTVEARVRLGGLHQNDVDVQLYYGALDAMDEVHDPGTQSMDHTGEADGVHRFVCKMPFAASGRFGYSVRVIPRHPDVHIPAELMNIRWANL